VYHDRPADDMVASDSSDGGAPSIHDLEAGIRLDARPPLDQDDRALFVDRVLPRGVRFEDYVGGGYWAILSWARERCAFSVERRKGGVEITCTVPEGRSRLEKRIWCDAEGHVAVTWRWEPSAAETGDLFATELSVAGAVSLSPTPSADEWRFEIETVAKSERGLDRTRQGESITLRWPVELGEASVELRPARGA